MNAAEGHDDPAAALGRLLRAWRAAAPQDDGGLATMTPESFRRTVAERLRALERDVGEIRVRVNSLLFVATGAVITNILIQLLGA